MWSLTKESTAMMDSESELEGHGSRKSRMMTLAEVERIGFLLFY